MRDKRTLQFQVLIKGPAVNRLTNESARALLLRALDDETIPDDVQISVHGWKAGKTFDLFDDHTPRHLRDVFRRLLPKLKVTLRRSR